MNKLKFLVFILISNLFISCNSDRYELNLIGTWESFSIKEETFKGETLQTAISGIILDENKTRLAFNPDKTFEETKFNEGELVSQRGGFKIEGELLFLDYADNSGSKFLGCLLEEENSLCLFTATETVGENQDVVNVKRTTTFLKK